MPETSNVKADTGRRIPESFRAAGVVRRRGDRMTYTRVLPVDIEAMRFILQVKYARPIQVAGWLGSSGGYAYERLRVLEGFGFLERDKYAVGLRDWPGEHTDIMGRAVTVWRVTQKGRNRLEPWTVVGESPQVPVLLKASKFAKSMADHSLGVADLAVLYRRWGFEVAFEREFVSLEMPQRAAPAVSSPVWCPHRGGRGHAPDLGVIHPDDGSRWGIELERAIKRESEYRDVIGTYQAAEMGQVWHAQSPATVKNLVAAARNLGITLRPQTINGMTVMLSEDGLTRIVSWRPNYVDPLNRAEWMKVWESLDGGTPPGGFEVSSGPVDLASRWRL